MLGFQSLGLAIQLEFWYLGFLELGTLGFSVW